MFGSWLVVLVTVGLYQNAVEGLKPRIDFVCKESARIKNGEVLRQFDRWRDLHEIRQANFFCKSGYQMNIKKIQKISFECTNGTWQGYFDGWRKIVGFGLKDVRCEKKPSRCPKPSLIDHGRYTVKSRFCKSIKKVSSCVGRFFTGDEVDYTCDLGYEMRPLKIEQSQKVDQNEDVEDGYGNYGDDDDGYDDYGYNDYGYDDEKEEEEEFQPQIPNFTCAENGVWKNGQTDQFPICDRIKCNGSRFENISNGYVKNFTDVYNYGDLEFGDVLELVCDRGYKPMNNNRHLECYDTKKFEEADFGCERIRCPNIPDPIGGRASFGHNKTRFVDDVVTFHCEGYKAKLLGPKTMTCLENGKWSSDRCVRCFPKDADCLPPCMHEGNKLKTANPTFKHGSMIQLTCSNNQDITHNRSCLLNNLWDKKDLYCKHKTDPSRIMSTAGLLKEALRSVGQPKNKSEENSEEFEGKSIREGEMPGGVEIYFALDVSGSISFDEFTLLKNFTTELIKQLNISSEPDGTRLSAYVFAQRTGLLFDGHWTNIKKVLTSTDEAVNKVEQLLNQSAIHKKMFEKDDEEFLVGQGTNIKALMEELIDTEMTKQEMKEYENRPTQRVAVIISDGEFNTAGNPEHKAQELKDMGVEIYSIYVGKDSPGARLGKEVMKSLNSSIANETHYFEIASEDFISVLNQMISRNVVTCGDVDESKKHFAKVNAAKKEPADKHAWPWMVQFKDVRCGGSLIDRTHVLTAAHCFYSKNKLSPRSEYTFFLKSHKLLFESDSSTVESQTVKSENIKIHEDYDMKKDPRYLYDIAIVTLPKPVRFDPAKTLRPICLPENEDIFDGVIGGNIPGIVTGWGKLRNGNDPDVLQQVQMVMPKQRKCTQGVDDKNKVKYNSTFMFCAGGLDGDTQVDSCSGDSGGPYVIKDPGNEDRFIQIGIVSSGFTTDCHKKDQYGLYTKLNNELLQWIRDTIQKEEDKVQ